MEDKGTELCSGEHGVAIGGVIREVVSTGISAEFGESSNGEGTEVGSGFEGDRGSGR
jgi:hypothetical protein